MMWACSAAREPGHLGSKLFTKSNVKAAESTPKLVYQQNNQSQSYNSHKNG